MGAASLPGNGASPGVSTESRGRALVEAELVASVAWLIRLRWVAGLGVIVATWLVESALNLDAPAGPLFAIGGVILLYNLVFYVLERRLAGQHALAASYQRLAIWQVGLDWLAMTLLIHYSGGIESPVILFFIFHVVIASIFFSPRAALAFAFLAIALVSGIALLEYSGLLPHEPISGFLPVPLYRSGLYVAAVLFFFASTSLIAAYLGSSIQERLRKRQAEIVSLTESLQQATIRLQALNDSARIVSSTLDVPQVLNRLVKTTAEAMGVRACSIRLLDKSGHSLEPVAVYGLSQAYLEKGPVDPASNPLAREVLSGKTVNIPDAPNSPLLQYPEEARQEGIHSMLSAPLIGKDGGFGIIRAYAVEPNHFTEEDEAFLVAIAAQGSTAIENALAYQAIEQLDATKSQFIRMVTHELRSPVSVTKSLLKTLANGYAGKVTPAQQDILNRASRRIDFLQSLVDDLLDLAAGKVEGKLKEAREPVDLAAVVQRVVSRFAAPAQERGVHLVWEPWEGETLTVLATAEGLDRVCDNLVSNAVKYTRPDGSVWIGIERQDQEAVIKVKDSGIGIPPEAMPHIFEEFFRAPNAKELEFEGTGLGLTIVKDLVARYGGRIAIQSQPEIGTTVTVTLPLVANAGQSANLAEQPA
jgi:signal transduction histidine kinase